MRLVATKWDSTIDFSINKNEEISYGPARCPRVLSL